MSNHIDQLAQWWENADEGIGKAGDVVIERDDSPNFETPTYVVFTLGRDEHENLTYRRVLARAPKPKPAWHDAVAVIATFDNEYGEDERGVWIPGVDGMWEDCMGRMIDSDDLLDPAPLIEAKVTDEMVERYQGEETKWRLEGGPSHPSVARHLLAAALGLETT